MIGIRRYNDFMEENGRPAYADEEYQKWLDDLAPFLKMGSSLHYAMEKACLVMHKDSIYRKFRLNDWFCEKIEAYRRYPGELVNHIMVNQLFLIEQRVKNGNSVSREDWHVLRFMAEKHRTCQPFFTQRYEVAHVESNDIERVLDELEKQSKAQSMKTDYAAVAEAFKIHVEANQTNEETTQQI